MTLHPVACGKSREFTESAGIPYADRSIVRRRDDASPIRRIRGIGKALGVTGKFADQLSGNGVPDFGVVDKGEDNAPAVAELANSCRSLCSFRETHDRAAEIEVGDLQRAVRSLDQSPALTALR